MPNPQAPNKMRVLCRHSLCPGPARSRGLGFTLIELLVVVAIIALLVAILAPTLQKAREKAELVVCLSNLKQIGTAMHTYTVDNNSTLPGYNDDGSDWPIGPTGASGYPAYITDMFWMGGLSEYDLFKATRPRKLNDYLVNAEVIFKCPSDEGMINVSPQYPEDRVPLYERNYLAPAAGFVAASTSYVYNVGIGLPCYFRTVPLKKTFQIKHPTRQVAFADMTMWNTWMELPPTGGPGTPSRNGYPDHWFAGYPWHDPPKYHSEVPWTVQIYDGRSCQLYPQRGNAVFVDAHAETVTFTDELVTEEYIIYEEN